MSRSALVAGVLLNVLLACQARVTHSEISKDERSWIELSQPFGFGVVGNVSIEVRNVKLHWTDTGPGAPKGERDYSQFAFYLADGDMDPSLDPNYDSQSRCDFAKLAGVQRLFTFNDTTMLNVMQHAGGEDDVAKRYSQEILGHGGVYTMYFANCADDAVVSFDATVRMYNVDAKGRKNFLSLGELELPTVYLVACLAFLAGLGLWCGVMYRERKSAHTIHALMIVLGAFKVLTLLAQCGMYHYIRMTGSPDGWNVAYYVFTFFRGIMFFSVVVLIGTGWSYMTPFLGDNEKRVFMVVIPLQVIANVAIVVMDEVSPARRSWLTWRDTMHLVDIICCCAVLLPIVWRIKHLRDAAQTDGKAARSIRQLSMFRAFYVMVVIYIYFTRIVVYLLETTLPYETLWVSTAAGELATLAFYILTAIQFRPYDQNQYFRLDDIAEP